MLELHNETALAAGIYPGWDRQRRYQFTVVLKAAWRFEPDGTLAPLSVPIVETDAHHGKPHETSLRAADETVPFKQGGEVYLYGTAHPPRAGAPFTAVRLGIDFPDGRRFDKTLHVFGRRRWRKRLLGHALTDPEPLEPTPLRYEYAFGGRVPGKPDVEYPPNPVGLGYNPSAWKLVNPEPPRIEDPQHLVAKPTHKPLPAGFAPLPVFWQPRADEIGEAVDDPDAHAGCPWPESAEPTLHNAAPPDQRFPHPFAGGERIRLAGFFPERDPARPVELVLPLPAPRLLAFIDGATRTLTPVFDTLVIDTDERLLQLIGRAAVAWKRFDPRSGWVILQEADLAGEEQPAQRRKQA